MPLSGGVGTYGSTRDLRLLASAPTETRDGWLVTVANHSPKGVTEYAWVTCAFPR